MSSQSEVNAIPSAGNSGLDAEGPGQEAVDPDHDAVAADNVSGTVAGHVSTGVNTNSA